MWKKKIWIHEMFYLKNALDLLLTPDSKDLLIAFPLYFLISIHYKNLIDWNLKVSHSIQNGAWIDNVIESSSYWQFDIVDKICSVFLTIFPTVDEFIWCWTRNNQSSIKYESQDVHLLIKLLKTRGFQHIQVEEDSKLLINSICGHI